MGTDWVPGPLPVLAVSVPIGRGKGLPSAAALVPSLVHRDLTWKGTAQIQGCQCYSGGLVQIG